MTCVLSMPPLFSFDEESELKNRNGENFDFSWITGKPKDYGLSEHHTCLSSRRKEPCPVSYPGSPSRAQTPDDLAQSTDRNELQNLFGDAKDAYLQTTIGELESGIKNRKRAEYNEANPHVDMCNTTPSDQSELTAIAYNSAREGQKRKSESVDDNPIPSKRISPFLNTNKEKRDEKKKILKLSLKKLRKLDDPETFLRRAVLVNNTMKKIQSELREEKYKTRYCVRKNRPFYNCGVLNNSCLSNCYLYDDPYLSGVHEKITDDMTDTLVKNVLNYNAGDVIAECDGTTVDSDRRLPLTEDGKHQEISADINVDVCSHLL